MFLESRLLSEKAGFYGQGERGQVELLPAPPRDPSAQGVSWMQRSTSRSHWSFEAFLAAAAVLGRAEQLRPQLCSTMLDIKATCRCGQERCSLEVSNFGKWLFSFRMLFTLLV